ncbi:MAG: hypothetical protein Kow00124_20090 [Anaerolineae bacterium]
MQNPSDRSDHRTPEEIMASIDRLMREVQDSLDALTAGADEDPAALIDTLRAALGGDPAEPPAPEVDGG